MEILRGCGLVSNLQHILGGYWEGQTVVPRSWIYYGLVFKTGWGVTQGDPMFPTIFKIVVNLVVREMLMDICGHQEAHYVLVLVAGGQDILFYAENVHIAGRNPI